MVFLFHFYYILERLWNVCGTFAPFLFWHYYLGDLRRMISLVVGSYFGTPPLLLPGLEPASPGMLTVLTRVHCLSLKPDMDREVRSHPDSRISAKVLSWELGMSRVLRPDDHRNHLELRHVSSLHYRLRHQSCLSFQLLFHSVETNLMATGATSRLKIKGARSEDSGNYTCTMMGMKATTSVELNIQPGTLVANFVL